MNSNDNEHLEHAAQLFGIPPLTQEEQESFDRARWSNAIWMMEEQLQKLYTELERDCDGCVPGRMTCNSHRLVLEKMDELEHYIISIKQEYGFI